MTLGLHVQRALSAGVERRVALEDATALLLQAPLHEKAKTTLMMCGVASVGAAWAECGFPMIEPGHKLAASLMATAIPDDEDLIWPWRCFGVSIPPGLLVGSEAPSFVIMLRRADTEEAIMLSFGEDTVRWDEEPKLAEHSNPEFSGKIERLGAFFDSSVSNRMHVLVGRLVVGCCIEVSSYQPSRPGGSGTSSKRGIPKQWVIKLGRPVKLDVREQVRSFSRGDGVKPSVQVLVRGHWKQQPCGPRNTQRKWKQMEPYWRGPEDAPVLVRPTRVG